MSSSWIGRPFEREGNRITLQRGLGSLSGTRELLTARTLALSVARRFDEPIVSEFASRLLRAQFLGSRLPWLRSSLPRRIVTRRWFEESLEDVQETLFDAVDSALLTQTDRAKALALLRMADLGIDDVMIDEEEALQNRVRLVHRTADGAIPLDFEAESKGTRTWLRLIGPV